MVATLLTGNAGLVAGALLARRYDLTRSRIRLVSLGGLMGGLAGAGFDLIVQPDDEDVALTIPLVLSVGGLALAAHMTRDRDDAVRPGGGGGGAMLMLDGGAGSMDLPVPTPTLVPAPVPPGGTAGARR